MPDGLLPQAGDHLIGSRFANSDRLELHPDLGLIAARAAAAGPGNHIDRIDIGIGAHLLLKPLRLLHQRLIGDVLLAQNRALQPAGILLREESLGDFDVEIDTHADRSAASAISIGAGLASTVSSAAEYVEMTQSKNFSVVR